MWLQICCYCTEISCLLHNFVLMFENKILNVSKNIVFIHRFLLSSFSRNLLAMKSSIRQWDIQI